MSKIMKYVNTLSIKTLSTLTFVYTNSDNNLPALIRNASNSNFKPEGLLDPASVSVSELTGPNPRKELN